MRTRTEAKRLQIVRIAAEAFEELGYERTSMQTIAERLAGSKQTLYNYFASKEDLLRAVLDVGIGEASEASIAEFDARARDDLRGALEAGALAFLSDELAPARIALVRTVIAMANQTDLGRDFYANAIQPAWQRLADCFAKLMDEGRLRRADPWLAALQFKAMSQLDLHERLLMTPALAPDGEEIAKAARSAADAFLVLYGPVRGPE
ncbi:MAG: TetR/AcrR family transcriptional regulator [Sphingomonadales bacterium]|nr:MAG: TetR/AcrR family transcriptional regulator [Sphingomonadales bacterium]